MASGLEILAALSWNPQVKGALYVAIAIVTLAGSAYMLLATNMGARLGFLLAAAGFFGWMTTQGAIWWVYAQGPIGRAPSWHVEAVVEGDLGRSPNDALEAFPKDWEERGPADPAVADAQGTADSRLVGPRARFASASDYVFVYGGEKGGDTYGPLHLINFRPFDVFHEPHYLVIQVQKALPAAEGAEPAPDPSAQPVSVLLVRDLGTLRLNPAIVCLACGLIFGVTCYQLHVRDKEAAARRE
jgi:hypothetical protein